MAARKASEVFVECLEAEGVEYVFGIPGEETLDLNESLADSSVRFVPVRHEQGGAYMADAYGRLTGRAGVCLGTLGPGATNLVTAVADAFLDRAPLVALTGQSDLERMHKESHQYIDLIGILRPVVKWNARVSSPEIIPEVVRKAFKVAESEKPGATHLELPEDVMQRPLEASPLPRRAPVQPEPGVRELQRARELIDQAENPIALAGNGAIRGHASRALRAFSHTTGIPVAETFMAKGLLDYEDPRALGTVGLQSRDYEMAGFEDADLVIAIGYDLVEHAPEHWNPRGDKRIIVIDSVAAEIDEFFMPDVELIGDIAHVLARLAADTKRLPTVDPPARRLHDLVQGALRDARDDDHFPMRPPRVLWDIRQALGREDMLVSDVGLHKLWIGRMFPAHEPGTVLIANGLAGMGFALPTAIAAKLVAPNRRVVTVSGDGGFLMNCQELETAMRLRTPIVNVVWENGQFGSIAWKQDKKFGRHFDVGFGNPDFVKLADSFGMPAWRCSGAQEFSRRLTDALALDVPSLIVVPIDYSIDVAISEQLGAETVAT
ncbi:MAG TPA: acetolactate synthase large subunit [Solirubrobacteraceae bacterium]|nr:acetolactate synthase large subunit [Solirubrobacteraceae bacterium]